jgi:putative oxidoreductase
MPTEHRAAHGIMRQQQEPMMDRLQPIAAFVARLALAWIFLLEGVTKLGSYSATAAYMQSSGVSSSLLPLVILTELGCGLLVVLGLFTRFAAFALMGFCLLTALFFHTNFADLDQTIHFNKNIAMAGGFLALVAFGGGAWSLDTMHAARRRERRQA